MTPKRLIDSDGQGQDVPGEDGQDGDRTSDAPACHDPSGTGEIMDAGARGDDDAGDGESPVDITPPRSRRGTRPCTRRINLARAEGKLPGGVEETVRNAHASTLDWRTLLRRYMTDAARSDYSWSFPNRRFIDGGLYLPSIRSEGIDTIAVIIDTSGSLPAQTLADFWAEVREVATEIQPESVHHPPGRRCASGRGRVRGLTIYPTRSSSREGAAPTSGRASPGSTSTASSPACASIFTDMLCSSYPEARSPAFRHCDLGELLQPTLDDWNREPWGERIDIAIP